MLKHFLEEDLVRIVCDNIRATTFSEFVTDLHTRAEFPFLEDLCLALKKEQCRGNRLKRGRTLVVLEAAGQWIQKCVRKGAVYPSNQP